MFELGWYVFWIIIYCTWLNFMEPSKETKERNHSQAVNLVLIQRIVWNIDIETKIPQKTSPSIWYLSTIKQEIAPKELTLQLIGQLSDGKSLTKGQCQSGRAAQQKTSMLDDSQICLQDYSQIYSLGSLTQQNEGKSLASINSELGLQIQKMIVKNKKLANQLSSTRQEVREKNKQLANYQYCKHYIKYLESEIQRHKYKGKPEIKKLSQLSQDYLQSLNYIDQIKFENQKLKAKLTHLQTNMSYMKNMGAFETEELKRLKVDKQRMRSMHATKMPSINSNNNILTHPQSHKVNQESKQIVWNQCPTPNALHQKEEQIQIKASQNKNIETNQKQKPEQPLRKNERENQTINQLRHQLEQHRKTEKDNEILMRNNQELTEKNKRLQKEYEMSRKNEESLRATIRLLQGQFQKLRRHLKKLKKSPNSSYQN